MRTRLDSSPRKHKEEGYGWNRPCADERCPEKLNHRNPGPYCYACERRRLAEGLEA